MFKQKGEGDGVGFCGLLTLIFITLKLTGAIAWSWWWVLSPVWIPIVLALLCFILICIFPTNKRRY